MCYIVNFFIIYLQNSLFMIKKVLNFTYKSIMDKYKKYLYFNANTNII